MAATADKEYPSVDASPVKSFFVSMLTRDITLEEAILDLLDNCVDGIHRQNGTDGDQPYAGYKAEIEFNKDSFSISDNCGGIPWKLYNYAFRMGPDPNRSDRAPGTIGVYGIGLKRAMFKMGRHCLISTQNADDRYEIEITPKWLADENLWDIPVAAATRTKKKDGTEIVIGHLYPGIKARFTENAEAFESDLSRMIATHYAFIIERGFAVSINGTRVKPKPIKLIFGRKEPRSKQPAIQPFIFKAEADDVSVFLAVGLTRPIPSQDEAASEQEETKYSSLDAGWTIVCNERAVLYCDRTELTGWGEASVPRYHNQFIAIAGIVEFKSDDPSKLPTTTTKRGVDASSALYLQIKNKMREGMRLFVDYTNKWKGLAEESQQHIKQGEALALTQLKERARQLAFVTTRRTVPIGQQYTPSLPMPKAVEGRTRRITFSRDIDEIRRVSEYLFEDSAVPPSAVGEQCFELALREATR
ncbi:MAG: ATP-binding protein [Vicinamibacterales bacterium]